MLAFGILLPAQAQNVLSIGASGQYHVYGENNFYGLASAGGGLTLRWSLPKGLNIQAGGFYNVSEDDPSVTKFYEVFAGVGYQWRSWVVGVDVANSQFPDDEFTGGWSGGVFAQAVLYVDDVELIAGGRVSPFNLFDARAERLYFKVHYRIKS